MAIRAVWMGPEAVEGTAAATLFFNKVESWIPVNDPKLDIPKETTNSTITEQHPVPGTVAATFTAKVRAYFDMSVHWFAMMYGVPQITADPGSSAGTFDHLFKPGGFQLLPYTVVWKQVGSKGVIYRQMTGCKAKSLKAAIMGNGGLGFEVSGFGRMTIGIVSAPSATDATASYNQPMNLSQQSLTLNAIAWTKPKKFDVNVDNGLAPDWAIQAQRLFDRLKPGDTTGTADIQAFYDAYSGSLIAVGDSATQLAQQIIGTWMDPTSNIGTGTITHPNLVWTLPKPYIGSPSEDSTNTDPEEKAKATLAYDNAMASNMSIKFHNEVAASVYTGT